MKINEIKCKTALSRSNLPGLTYSLNPYRGCEHSCCYCYVPNVLRIKRLDWGCFVNVKTNIPVVLSKELKKKKKGVVALSTVTDPYQPIEEKYRLTRYCLEQLLRYDFPVHIQTKSDLVLRDIDLISKFSDVEVMFSIGTLDDSDRNILEPFAKPIISRLKAMKTISENRIKTSVFFGPVYSTIKLDEIEKIIETFIKYGANEIMIDKFNLKPGILQNLIKSNYKDIRNINNKKFFNEFKKEFFKLCKEKKVKATCAF